MSYEAKTNWQGNDPVTESDLNRWEQGIKDSHEGLSKKLDATEKGIAGGVATLDENGKLKSGQLDIPSISEGTTTTKGIVQLSSATDSTSETLAATPKAVKDAKDGLSTQIGILSGLNTTAKSNLVSAVNELFTFANDGKTKWSNVVGSPLASSDTFTQMQIKTQIIKDSLATNLTAKGQSSTGTETLTALVNKVASVITGRRRASGSVSQNTGSSGNVVIDIQTLSFRPSIVIIKGNFNGATWFRLCEDTGLGDFLNSSYQYQGGSVQGINYPINFFSNGFKWAIYSFAPSQVRTAEWIAIE